MATQYTDGLVKPPHGEEMNGKEKEMYALMVPRFFPEGTKVTIAFDSLAQIDEFYKLFFLYVNREDPYWGTLKPFRGFCGKENMPLEWFTVLTFQLPNSPVSFGLAYLDGRRGSLTPLSFWSTDLSNPTCKETSLLINPYDIEQEYLARRRVFETDQKFRDFILALPTDWFKNFFSLGAEDHEKIINRRVKEIVRTETVIVKVDYAYAC